MHRSLHRSWVPLAALLGSVAFVPNASAAGKENFDRRFEFQAMVVDPAPSHIHAPGQNFSVGVTPFMLIGDNLASLTKVALTPASDAAKAQNAARAAELLFDGKEEYGGSVGIAYDFYFAPPEKHTLTVNVPLSRPAVVKYLALVGQNPNNEYDVAAAQANLLYTDGTTRTVQLPLIHEGSTWRALMQCTDLKPLQQVDLALSVPYKVNITELTIRGNEVIPDPNPFKAYEWKGVNLHAHWQTADGKRLSDPVALKLGETTQVPSPQNPGEGYYGLRIEGDQGGMVIFQKEYGFGVAPLTEPPTQVRPDSMFGMVHWHFDDKFLHPAWTKTLTCDPGFDESTQKLDPKAWQDQINWRAQQGYMELPLAINGWSTDPNKPVADEQVRKIQNRMEQYFRATPDVLYWELGIEENLPYRGSGHKQPYFWSNTEAKAKAVREAAQRVNPKIKLVYQIAELDFTTIEQFCKGSVSRQFDVLSLHPYAWASYPMPDVWQADMINKTKAWMKEGGHELEIWYTEVGAPVNGNPGGFFGYPGEQRSIYDNGLTTWDYATYLTRMHVEAASLGVQKLFWYNYSDWGFDSVYAERNFGLVDAYGFPKPGYVAYANMVRMLEGRKFVRAEKGEGISRFLFEGPGDNCWVMWTPDADAKPVAVNANLGTVQKVVDNYGGTVAAQKLECGGSPLFVVVAK